MSTGRTIRTSGTYRERHIQAAVWLVADGDRVELSKMAKLGKIAPKFAEEVRREFYERLKDDRAFPMGLEMQRRALALTQ